VTTQAVFNSLELFAEYSAAGYCKLDTATFSNNVRPKTLVCPNCRTINSSTLKPLIVLAGNMLPMLFGTLSNPFTTPAVFYVARDTNHSAIIVSFSGTDTTNGFIQVFEDIAAPVIASPFRGPNCAGCDIASAFLNSWASVSDSIVKAVKAELALSNQHNFSVVFTGHSLGGALAGIAAAEARANGTFGTNPVNLVSRIYLDNTLHLSNC
jgi:hypothetical protein